jgi:hypothetical protein
MMNFLKQPYPVMPADKSIRTSLFIGLFVFLFLAVFQPFGIYTIAENFLKYLFLAGFGFITFLVCYFFFFGVPRMFPDYFQPNVYTIGKNIFISMVCIFFIGCFNLLYSAWVVKYNLSLQTFLSFQLITLSVGLFPTVVTVAYRYDRLMKRNTASANELNAGFESFRKSHPESKVETDRIKFQSETAEEDLSIAESDFVFAESADNYIKLHYLREGKLKQHLIRQTMTKLQDSLTNHPSLIRCHRSFLVNLNQVISANGNAQGLRLSLRHTDLSIPVSRKMAKQMREQLAENDRVE